ncbi:hypothetical protein CLOP_g2937 [Closterium sp. NIES-67]|nr:hypothetical protein CLOP_g2937 [Closterium sp. NIES-67]
MISKVWSAYPTYANLWFPLNVSPRLLLSASLQSGSTTQRKRYGTSGHPCLTPFVTSIRSPIHPFTTSLVPKRSCRPVTHFMNRFGNPIFSITPNKKLRWTES